MRCGASTWTRAGSSKDSAASCRISSENVAENRRFWRSVGSSARIRADVVDEAHVEHPVGLVEDEDLDRAEVDGALADVVEQSAGRGDDDLGPAAQARGAGCRARRRRRWRSNGSGGDARRSGSLLRPGSRAHASARARGPERGARGPGLGWRSACSRWMIGRTKAAVLPVPVWAPARTSRPARTWGSLPPGPGWGARSLRRPRLEGARATARVH